MLGTSTYPYFYDRPYVSSMALYANQLARKMTLLSLLIITQICRKIIFLAILLYRKIFSSAPTHMALTDKGHGWQNIFFDPEVWGDEFTEIGILILPNIPSAVNIASNQQNNYASSHHIFQRTGLPRNIEFHSFYPEIYELANVLFWLQLGRLKDLFLFR